MKTARRLSSAKDFWKPRKARGQCRRHDDARKDLQGREDKNYAKITKLLNRIKRVSFRRQIKMRVDEDCLQGGGKNFPRSGHEPPALGRGKQQYHIKQSGDQPPVDCPK